MASGFLDLTGLKKLVSLIQGMPDNKSLEYTSDLHVKDGGIDDEQISSGKALVPLTGTEGQVLTRTAGGVGWAKSGGNLLWEGAVNSGTISIPGSSGYDVFGIVGTSRVNRARYYFAALCSRFDNGVVYGGASAYSDNPSTSPGYLTEFGYHASFDAKTDGESWTGNNAPSSFVWSNDASSFNRYAQVTQIWGIG